MKLYHGTNKDFDRIDLLKSKPNKDFGRGFYLSADYGQALNMAQVKVEQLETGYPVVQSYLVEDDALDALHVLRFDGYSELFPLPQTGKSFMPIGCIRFSLQLQNSSKMEGIVLLPAPPLREQRKNKKRARRK